MNTRDMLMFNNTMKLKIKFQGISKTIKTQTGYFGVSSEIYA